MRTSTTFPTSRGFTLVEVAVVLLILAVVIAMAAAITRGVTAAQKRSLTATRIAAVDAALVQFVAMQRRLPCPADGTLASTHNNAGLEGPRTGGAGCTGDQAHGVVPWRALALTELEMTDGYDRRLTYRVFPILAADGGMDMSWCDPAGTAAANAPNSTCNVNTGGACSSAAPQFCTPPSSFLATKGLRVQNLAGTALLMNPSGAPNTGAAYVVISPGESGGGGYLNGGTLGASSSTDGTEEAKNYANQPYVAATTYYVDDALAETPGNGHFDDVVSRPSIMAIASKAGLGPRTH
jgi:prepilin-type N-terminal cleavage/methylation domain-containing protein